MGKYLKPGVSARESAREPYIAVFSFGLLYSFYNSYYRDFANSPVINSVRTAGADVGVFNICLLLAFVAGLFCCFSWVWSQFICKKPGLKIAVHVLAFVTPLCIPLSSAAWLVYVFVTVSAFFFGMVIGRALYTVIFASINTHPARSIAIAYTLIQAYLHAHAILPVLSTLPYYYALGAPTLLVGLLFCFMSGGEEMERRRVLPENRLRFADVWPSLAFIALAQICFALYESALLPQISAKPLDAALQIIPNAVTLLVFYLFGKRFTFNGVMIALVALFFGGSIVFIATDGQRRVFVELFTQPSYLFFDLLYLWLMQTVFRTYGRRLAQFKLYVVANIAVHVTVFVLISLAFSRMPEGTGNALLLLPPAFCIALLMPQVQRVIRRMDAQREYAEARDEHEVPLPDQREDVLAARDALLSELSPGIAFSDEELTVLAYLVDGQTTDVTAHFMGLSVSGAQSLINGVVAKFGCRNTTELIVLTGAAQIKAGRRALISTLFDTYGLTEREREICELLLSTGLAQKHISEKVGLSGATVNYHIKNLYRKLDIQSRAELVVKFAEPDGLPNGFSTQQMRGVDSLQ